LLFLLMIFAGRAGKFCRSPFGERITPLRGARYVLRFGEYVHHRHDDGDDARGGA
jgi:hypothetical protein